MHGDVWSVQVVRSRKPRAYQSEQQQARKQGEVFPPRASRRPLLDFEIGARILSVIAYPNDEAAQARYTQAVGNVYCSEHSSDADFTVPPLYVIKPGETLEALFDKGHRELVNRVVVGRIYAERIVRGTPLESIEESGADELVRSHHRHREHSRDAEHLCLALYLMVNDWSINEFKRAVQRAEGGGTPWKDREGTELWWKHELVDARRKAIDDCIGRIWRGDVSAITKLLRDSRDVRTLFDPLRNDKRNEVGDLIDFVFRYRSQPSSILH